MSKFRTSWMKRRPKRNRRNPPEQASMLVSGHDADYPAQDRPSEQDTTPQARGPLPQDDAGGDGGLVKTAMFERPREAREDVRLARMAIRKRWEPTAEETHAVLTKATIIALQETAPAPVVLAVAKLHLDAHRQVQADEHHDDRLEYHERALQIRSKVGDYIPPAGAGSQIGINVATGGNLTIVLPHNFRDEGMVDEEQG